MATNKSMELEVDIDNFNKELQKFAKSYPKEQIPALMKEVALGFLQEVIPLTPVDTGRARAGWYPALEKLGGSSPGTNNGEGDIEMDLSGDKQSITIANRVHYTIFLEFGHSKQAPGGMVRISLRKMARALKEKSKSGK